MIQIHHLSKIMMDQMVSAEAFHHSGHYGSLSPTSLQLGHHDSSKGRDTSRGSTWIGASFNLTSSIVGAGCIGLGGAIANSGGLVSIIAITVFAVLSKFSFDLVVSLAIEVQGEQASSYEGLGQVTCGEIGKLSVIISKGIYSFGCLVAYIVIIKDNFSLAVYHLLFGYNDDVNESQAFIQSTLSNQNLVTIFLCSSIMLPLCLLRDLKPLERFSALKISAVLLILIIVIYLFLFLSHQKEEESSFVDHWFVVRGGVFESLGTFVFTFVAQHAVHLVFESLDPRFRNMENFQKTTSLATLMSTVISFGLGLVVYMTYWEHTSSAMFNLYPPSAAVDICRILLCISMLLTYPFPFLTVRELLILLVFSKDASVESETASMTPTEPLVGLKLKDVRESWLQPGQERQLKPKQHFVLTILLWSITLILALAASSLGDVLNLTGCATGTVISYILPALFSYKLRGHTILGSLLFILGGAVGLAGTFYSIVALF